MQAAAKQSREDARVAWEQGKIRSAALATRADVTASLQATQEAGARESIEQLSQAARELYENKSQERHKAKARLDLANQLKRKQRHAMNTEMVEDVVASLVFLATATVSWLKAKEGWERERARLCGSVDSAHLFVQTNAFSFASLS